MSPARQALANALADFSASLWCVAPQTSPVPKATTAAAASARARRGMPLRARAGALKSTPSLASASLTGIDWIIIGFALLMALQGSRSGFIVGALSLMGFVAGAFIGTRVGPILLPKGSASPYAPLFGLFGAVLAGSVLAGGLEGVGVLVRRRLVLPGLGPVDATLGAALSVVIALGMAWLAGAVILQVPQASSNLRRAVQRSAILRGLNGLLPPSGVILHALARFDPFPSVAGPQANVPAPTSKIAGDPDVRRAADGVVKVLGTACGLGVEGSGWIARPGLVVTNAHVRAGEDETAVRRH